MVHVHTVLEASRGCTSFLCVCAEDDACSCNWTGCVHFPDNMKGMCTDSFNANKITGSVETQHAQRP